MIRFIKYMQIIFSVYVKITTFVVLAAAVYIGVFWGADTELSVVILWQILIVSGICSLVSLVPMNGEKELSKASLLFRNALSYAYINIVVLGFGFYFNWFYFSNWKMVLGMEICILMVFIAVMLTEYFIEYKTAEKMNEKLKERE